MAAAKLSLEISNLLRGPLHDSVTVRLVPAAGALGGVHQVPPAFMAGTSLTITGIHAANPFTDYIIALSAECYRVKSFKVRIRPGDNTCPPVRMAVKPDRVQALDAPAYSELTADERRLLTEETYDGLSAKAKACFLNIATKAADPNSTGNCLRRFTAIARIQQDRIFATVESGLFDEIVTSPFFKRAPGLLHEPLSGFIRADSFKSRDRHGNLQLSFMQDPETGAMAVDVDIDEVTGFPHLFEVTRNHVLQSLTDPFEVREVLLASTPPLNPRYDFLFVRTAHSQPA